MQSAQEDLQTVCKVLYPQNCKYGLTMEKVADHLNQGVMNI